jgi:hypothetical protein
MPDQFRTANALTATAYAGSDHAAVLMQAMRTLREIHGPPRRRRPALQGVPRLRGLAAPVAVPHVHRDGRGVRRKAVTCYGWLGRALAEDPVPLSQTPPIASGANSRRSASRRSRRGGNFGVAGHLAGRLSRIRPAPFRTLRRTPIQAGRCSDPFQLATALSGLSPDPAWLHSLGSIARTSGGRPLVRSAPAPAPRPPRNRRRVPPVPFGTWTTAPQQATTKAGSRCT